MGSVAWTGVRPVPTSPASGIPVVKLRNEQLHLLCSAPFEGLAEQECQNYKALVESRKYSEDH